MPNKDITQILNGPVSTESWWEDGSHYGPELTSTRLMSFTHKTIGTNNGRRNRPVSPYYLKKELKLFEPGTYTRYNRAYKFTEISIGVTYDIDPDYLPLTAQTSTAINQALGKLKAGGTNLGVMFGEMQKTIDMIKIRLDQIRAFANWARNGSRNLRGRKGRKRRGRTENEVQNLWLELQYGWLPLMQDLDGLLSALAGNVAHPIVRAVGRSKDYQKIASIKKPWLYEKDKGIVYTGEERVFVQCILYAELDSALKAAASAMGLTNPLEVAWELVPFSFVADWFLPIGSALAAVNAACGYTFKGGCVSTLRKISYSQNVQSYCPDGGGSWERRTSSGSFDATHFNRSVLTAFPQAQIPHFKNPLSTAHCVNALELLVQTFRSKLR